MKAAWRSPFPAAVHVSVSKRSEIFNLYHHAPGPQRLFSPLLHQFLHLTVTPNTHPDTHINKMYLFYQDQAPPRAKGATIHVMPQYFSGGTIFPDRLHESQCSLLPAQMKTTVPVVAQCWGAMPSKGSVTLRGVFECGGHE